MQVANPTALGIDLGGSKLLIGEVTRSGELLRKKRYATGCIDQDQATKLILDAMDDYIATVGWADDKPSTMGVGVVGQVDYKSGVWVMIDGSRKKPTPIKKILSERYGIPCFADNDTKNGAVAEYRYGAGRNCRDLVYMNVGTGIASVIITDGIMLRGINNGSGEVGHMVVDYNSEVMCGCGRRGCVEAIASGYGLNMRARSEISRYPESPLGALLKDRPVYSREIFHYADEGDRLSKKLAYEAVDALAATIMNLVRVADPEIFLIGGGVMADGWMLPKIKERLLPGVMEGVVKGIAVSQIDPSLTGVIGAAAIGFEGLSGDR